MCTQQPESRGATPSLQSDVSLCVVQPWHKGDSHYVTGALGREGGRALSSPPTDNGHPEAAVTWETWLRNGCRFWLLPTLCGRLQCCGATSLWWTVKWGIILQAWIITVHNNELSYLLGPLWTIETKVILWDSLSMGCRDRDEAAFNIIRWGIVSDCRVTNERNRRKYAVYMRFLLWVLVPHVFITIFMRSYVKSSP